MREIFCKIGKHMYDRRMIDSNSGNLSVRLDSGHVLITPSGVCKGDMQPEDMIVVDLDGKRVDEPNAANRDHKPSSETPMHLEALKRRPDINAVVHGHPPHAVALTIAGIDLHTYTIPEAIIQLGEVPIMPYATPASVEDADVIASYVEKHNAMMLAYHGSLTLGHDPWQAYLRLDTLEHIAHIIFLARQLGGGERLPDHQIEKLWKLRHQFGFQVPGELMPV